MGVADHREQRPVLPRPVHDPVGVEDLVAAVLGVGLREHGEFGVGRVARHAAVGVAQVGDFLVVQGQPEARIGLLEIRQRDALQRPRRDVPEHGLRLVDRCEHAFGHPVVQKRADALSIYFLL